MDFHTSSRIPLDYSSKILVILIKGEYFIKLITKKRENIKQIVRNM